MTRKTAADFEPEVLKLFDKYVHGIIPRREFLKNAAKFAVAGVTAEGLLEALSPKFAEAQEVQGNDPRIKAQYVEYPSPAGYGTLRGYLVQPANASGKPYQRHANTAAHMELPFGAMVRVTNLANGKSVVVRVNDRGNFPRGRIIDLSKAAFSAIGNPRAGLIKVKIEAL